MIDKNTFNKIKRTYGKHSSWCVWDKWDSNKNDYKLNIDSCEWQKSADLLDTLNNDYVFVALNPSGSGDQNAATTNTSYFASFHSNNRYHRDYNLRYALYNTKYWGSYITDFVKDIVDSKSEKVKEALKKDNETLEKCINELIKELKCINSPNKITLIAIGSQTYNYLNKNKDRLGVKSIVKINHYSLGRGFKSSFIKIFGEDEFNKFNERERYKKVVHYQLKKV